MPKFACGFTQDKARAAARDIEASFPENAARIWLRGISTASEVLPFIIYVQDKKGKLHIAIIKALYGQDLLKYKQEHPGET